MKVHYQFGSTSPMLIKCNATRQTTLSRELHSCHYHLSITKSSVSGSSRQEIRTKQRNYEDHVTDEHRGDNGRIVPPQRLLEVIAKISEAT